MKRESWTPVPTEKEMKMRRIFPENIPILSILYASQAKQDVKWIRCYYFLSSNCYIQTMWEKVSTYWWWWCRFGIWLILWEYSDLLVCENDFPFPIQCMFSHLIEWLPLESEVDKKSEKALSHVNRNNIEGSCFHVVLGSRYH